MNKLSSLFTWLKSLSRTKLGLGILAVLLAGIGGYFLFSSDNSATQTVIVERGAISETVSLTGNTISTKNVSLTFGSGGIISRTYSDLGKKVTAGQILAELNTNDLAAGVRSARASVSMQQAKLDGLLVANPAEQTKNQNTVEETQEDLDNAYTNGRASLSSALSRMATVLTTIDELLDCNTGYISTCGYGQSDTEKEYRNRAASSWYKADDLVEKLSKKYRTITLASSPAEIENVFKDAREAAIAVADSARYIQDAVVYFRDNEQQGLDTTKADEAYDTATSEVVAANTILSDVNSSYTTIVDTKRALQEAQLDLTSDTSPTDIAAQQAQLEQAKANLDSAIAKLQNARITAPISGTITQFDAKIGQQASPGAALVSIISDTGYEVDGGVSEIDVGKISLGDKVTMSLDAFPGETFDGSVFYIAPAETNTQGVVSYAIKISFDKADPRLKSGLTANVNIETNRKDNVLILPQYAILQNDDGTFVQVLDGEKRRDIPVTLGIQDQNGNVEILSGVTEGEQVLNIGLKSK